MALMTLGDLELDGFEIPAGVRFGGEQRATVHKLLGGGRIIDTMGRDDAALCWQGVFSGAGASDRARTLDAMRAAGGLIDLAWDVFSYAVMITDLELQYCSPWWIVYSITCTVQADLAQSAQVSPVDVASSVLNDLAAASGFSGVSGIVATLSAPQAFVPGTAALTTAIAGLTSIQTNIGAGIQTAEAGLDGTDLPGLVSSSGTLAQLCTFLGFIGRSLINLAEVAS